MGRHKIEIPDIIRMAQRARELAGFMIDPVLVAAIACVESNRIPEATRYEAHYRWTVGTGLKPSLSTTATELWGQKASWGLLQIMGAVARERGFLGWFPELCAPEVGIWYGMAHLNYLRERFPAEMDFVAAYNAGSPRKRDNGQYVNQGYIDKVFYKKGSISQ